MATLNTPPTVGQTQLGCRLTAKKGHALEWDHVRFPAELHQHVPRVLGLPFRRIEFVAKTDGNDFTPSSVEGTFASRPDPFITEATGGVQMTGLPRESGSATGGSPCLSLVGAGT